MLSKFWLIYIVSDITYMFTLSYFNRPPVYSKNLEKSNSRPTAYFSIKAHSKPDILQAPIQRHPPLAPIQVCEQKSSVIQHFYLPPPSTQRHKLRWTNSGTYGTFYVHLKRMTWKFERRTYFLYHNFLGVHPYLIHWHAWRGPGSSVGIATGWGSNPGGGEIFRTCPDRPWGPTSLLYNGYRVFPGGRKRPGRDADPSPPSSAEV
jgi:hypothetical protein